MKIAVVMPVILKEQPLLELTRESVSHLRTKHDATLYVVCNALHVCTAEELQKDLEERFGGQVVVLNEPGVTRSVAGSWNVGTQLAFASGARYVGAIANDALLREDCLDTLVEFGEQGSADLWSGISYNNLREIGEGQETDGADFTCFMFTEETVQKHGWFDTNFKPAYFEDNDYYARVVLGGGRCRVVHRAQLFHHGSMTIRHDPVAAHHVSNWFDLNRKYFVRKWGVPHPAGSSEGVLRSYYHHPFNDPRHPLSWFPENGNP
jgi:GT2 family glycosyltransferase